MSSILPDNPFYSGKPLPPEYFQGRDDELQWVRHKLQELKNGR